MARILVVCPICGAELEAEDEHVGRDGQCSSCEQIVPIRPAPLPGQSVIAEGWLEGAHHYEYTNPGALLALGAMGLVLLVLVGSCLVAWTPRGAFAAGFVMRERIVLLVITLACCVYMAASLLMRKSMVPAVLTSAGWGMTVTIWTGGILQSASRLLKEAEAGETAVTAVGRGLQPEHALYLALVAGLLLIGAGVYFYRHYKENTLAARKIGPLFMVLQIVGLAVGLAVIYTHIKPGLRTLAQGGQIAATEPAPPSSAVLL
jgi:hypothetical protein